MNLSIVLQIFIISIIAIFITEIIKNISLNEFSKKQIYIINFLICFFIELLLNLLINRFLIVRDFINSIIQIILYSLFINFISMIFYDKYKNEIKIITIKIKEIIKWKHTS